MTPASDTYSNLLYVLEDGPSLSLLAQRAQSIERFSPESCAVVGNYYSQKGKHEVAVKYFRRALELNPRYLSAYTLMGHGERGGAEGVLCVTHVQSTLR